jgi:serine/threonine-protein kinase
MLSPGARLGPYEVIEQIGAGGMGEVYRAKDTKLGREVALKILPSSFTNDPERVARFRREAQVLAALNHPHIAQIYDLEEVDDTQFLVLELVDGDSLDKHIARGPIPVDEALGIARKIAEALEAAHEKGIIHRDLKPANIAVTKEGQVKVLDFGLAKAIEPTASSDLSMSPTITTPAMMTGVGVILGTAAYMSPEQAKGRAADKRSDIWAFGCVLYEMFTGKRPFDGEDLTEVLAAVVKSEPDWSAIPAAVPPHVVQVIKKCVAKDRKARVPDVSAVRFLLDEATPVMVLAAPGLGVAPTRLWRRLGMATILVAIGLALGVGATWWITRPRSSLMVRFTVAPVGSFTTATDRAVTITPDGRYLVYQAGLQNESQLFVRAVDQLQATPLRGLLGPRSPFVSPDGKWIAYFSVAGELRKVSITGGPPITIAPVYGQPRGGTWGDNGTLIYGSTSAGLVSVPAGGGEPRILTRPDAGQRETSHVFPRMLPGSRAVLFTVASGADVENFQIAALDLRTMQRKTLLRGATDGQYVASGHIVYSAAGLLRAVRFDPSRLEVLSDPVPIGDSVLTKPTGAAEFAVSSQGTLAYVPGGLLTASQMMGVGGRRSLVWVDRNGREEAIDSPPRAYMYPRISPNGLQIAIDVRDQDNDVWIWDIAHKNLRRLTLDPSGDFTPLWTPDSRQIIFASTRAGQPNLYRRSADGTGSDERLTTGGGPQFPTSVSPDGNQVIVRFGGPNFNIGVWTSDGKSDVKPLMHSEIPEQNGELSPDGHWLAYEGLVSNQPQIYVQPFPNVSSGRWQISTAGGTKPAWARNGRELFFIAPDGYLMAVTVPATSSFTFGNPVRVLNNRYYSSQQFRTYDVAADGRRFLMVKEQPKDPSDTASTPNIVVVLNWLEDLKARAPTR